MLQDFIQDSEIFSHLLAPGLLQDSNGNISTEQLFNLTDYSIASQLRQQQQQQPPPTTAETFHSIPLDSTTLMPTVFPLEHNMGNFMQQPQQ